MNINMIKTFSIALLITFCLVWLALLFRPGHEDIVFINGNILTVNDNNDVVEALAISSGKILAIGSDEQLDPYIKQGFRVVDLEGKTVTPGFIDAHSHFPGSGYVVFQASLNSPPIGNIKNIKQLQDTLRAQLKNAGPEDWISGNGYDDSLLAEKRHPSREELDAVSSQHPVWIFHTSGHLAVVNSKALSLLGYDEKSPDPEGGKLGRDASGKLNGLLEENAVHHLLETVPQPSILQSLEMLEYANLDYLSSGVTTAQSGLLSSQQLKGLGWASKLGQTPLRIIAWPDSAAADEIINGSLSKESFDSEHFDIGAVKLVADGSIQGYTGYLASPYHSHTKADPDYRGYPRTTLDELARQITKYHNAGMQIAVHGNGDAAIDNIIHAWKMNCMSNNCSDARPIIVHAQMASESQLEQMLQTGMTPSFFNLHTYYWGDRHRDIFLGHERASNISPTKWALDRGLKFSLHTDTPVVPMNPLLMMWSAVNRTSWHGHVIGKHQRISRQAALRAITADAAWQVFQGSNRGSLEPGKHADLVILDKNPLDENIDLRSIQVLQTWVDGIPRFRQ